jgi:hypothetical protein
VNLYGGKTAVKFNIVEAVNRLQDLIREHGTCFEHPPQTRTGSWFDFVTLNRKSDLTM